MSVAEQTAHEPAGDPSMADILASIRRILSEDEPGGVPQPAGVPEASAAATGHVKDGSHDDEVLVLDHSMMVNSSERLPSSDHDRHTAEDSTVKTAPLPSADHGIPAGPETISASTTPSIAASMAQEHAAATAAVPQPVAPPPPVVIPPPLPEGISQKANWPVPAPALSDQVTVATAASSLVNLVKSVAAERSATIQRGGLSIEDVVREEVRPLLKAWLDAHLPSVVERLVQAEIERVVNRAAS